MSLKFLSMKKLNQEQIERMKKLVSKTLCIIGIGLLYLIWVRVTDIRIPCVYYSITDKYCPGCGITRMVVALSKLDFEAALHSNALVLVLLPFFCVILLQKALQYIKSGKCEDRLWMQIGYIIAFVLTVIFWILRNLEAFSFLAP